MERREKVLRFDLAAEEGRVGEEERRGGSLAVDGDGWRGTVFELDAVS
jgi:hypothetical protein